MFGFEDYVMYCTPSLPKACINKPTAHAGGRVQFKHMFTV